MNMNAVETENCRDSRVFQPTRGGMAQEKQTPETRVIVAMAILTCFMDGCGCVEQVTQPRKIVPDLGRTHSGHVARYETYARSLHHQTIKRVGCFGES